MQIVVACVNNSDAQQISNVQQAYESDSQIETGTVCENISILCKPRVYAHVIARFTLKLQPGLYVRISAGFVKLVSFLRVQHKMCKVPHW